MKNNLTELVFILDRSGSMGGLESDTIGGYNSFIEKQKLEKGEAKLSTVLFDDKYEVLHNRLDIHEVERLTTKEYFVRGSTALLDAIGSTISTVGNDLNETNESERPSKVLFVIITDGVENASKEYSLEKVRAMIEHQRSKYSWEFLFLGANIDAVKTAQDIGIKPARAANYAYDAVGVRMCYDNLEKTVSAFRTSNKLSDDWKTDIEADHKRSSTPKSQTPSITAQAQASGSMSSPPQTSNPTSSQTQIIRPISQIVNSLKHNNCKISRK